MRKLYTLLLVIGLLALAVVPAAAQDDPTIADLVVSSSEAEEAEFTVLLAAVQAADPVFLELLSDSDEALTVFAPTDAAFGELLDALGMTAEELLAETDLLNEVLAYHVVPAALYAEDVVAVDGAYIGTFLEGKAVSVSVEDGSVFIDDSEVVSADVEAANGVVHVIDSVLLPAEVEDEEMLEMMETMEEAQEEPTMSITEIVADSASAEEAEFTVLLAAVQAADPAVLEALSEGGPYTVFAPTDAAFAAALEALDMTAEELLADTELLTEILAYHVVLGSFSTLDLGIIIELAGMDADMPSFATALPGTFISLTDVGVNEAGVIGFDIMATNGVVHVIDGVLLPPEE